MLLADAMLHALPVFGWACLIASAVLLIRSPPLSEELDGEAPLATQASR